MTTKKPQKTARIQIYLTKEDHEEISRAARDAGMTMAAFLRFATMRALKEKEPQS